MDEAQTRLIVMLTHRDCTVPNAPEIFAQCRNTPAEYWGFKEKGLPLPATKAPSRPPRPVSTSRAKS